VERSLVELSVEFALTKQQYEDEERLGTASTLATRAANLLAQAEDLLIYQGDSARQNPLFQRVQLRSGSAGAGLVGAIIVGGLADQIIEVEPTEVPDPNDPTQNRYGEHTFAAVAQGYSLLQSKGHYGPYALVLHTNIYADTYAPLPTTLIMPADRIKELVTAGFYGTGTLPPFTGLLTSLGGNTMDLAVGVDSVTAFTQIDSEEQYRLRVYERFALRLKDVTALILLKFLPAQKGHPG